MRKINIKKAEVSIDKVILWTLGILILAIAVFMIFESNIMDFIKNQPGAGVSDTEEDELTCDQMKLLDYERIGRVVFEKIRGDIYMHWYIYFEYKTEISDDAECKKNGGSAVKDVCFFNYCPAVDIKIDKCKSTGADDKNNYEIRKGCFDAAGNLIYKEEKLPTYLFIQWESNEEGSGKLVWSKGGTNPQFGKFENFFFYVDDSVYSKVESDFLKMGITEKMMTDLNEAKYITGGIYKRKTAAAAGSGVAGTGGAAGTTGTPATGTSGAPVGAVTVMPSPPIVGAKSDADGNIVLSSSIVSKSKDSKYVITLAPYITLPAVNSRFSRFYLDVKENYINIMGEVTGSDRIIVRIMPSGEIYIDMQDLVKKTNLLWNFRSLKNIELQGAITTPGTELMFSIDNPKSSFQKSNLKMESYTAILRRMGY